MPMSRNSDREPCRKIVNVFESKKSNTQITIRENSVSLSRTADNILVRRLQTLVILESTFNKSEPMKAVYMHNHTASIIFFFQIMHSSFYSISLIRSTMVSLFSIEHLQHLRSFPWQILSCQSLRSSDSTSSKQGESRRYNFNAESN